MEKDLYWADVKYDRTGVFNFNLFIFLYKYICWELVNWRDSQVCYGKDFPKKRYNTYAKSCNSNLYTKYPGATYSGLLLGTMRCL